MIASKQLAFGKAAGNKLPIGVFPIEYLESMNDAFIVTNVIPQAEDVINCKFSISDIGNYTGPYNSVYGVWNDIPNHWLTIKIQSTDFQVWCFYPYQNLISNSRFYPNTVYNTSLDLKNRLFILDDSRVSIPNVGTPHPNQPPITLAPVSANYRTVIIYSFSVIRNGVVICDLIPVRKGKVGYMYDRVSGQLFGNQGTGEFVLGPDLIDYTAKDYIQDGLVAMWDGIENAGWGKHDASATAWKDLVGASDLAINGAWGEDFLNGYGNITFDIYKDLYKDLCNNRTLTISLCSAVTDRGILFRYGASSDNCWYTADGVPYKQLRIHSGLDNVASLIPSVGTIFNASIVIGKSECTLWINEEKVKKINYGGIDVESSYFLVGGTALDSSSKMRSFRMYNRALTAEEIAHNYEIDKQRFGL